MNINNMDYDLIIHEAEEGGYWVEVPELPGCFTEGDSVKELIINLKEAIEGYLMVSENLT